MNPLSGLEEKDKPIAVVVGLCAHGLTIARALLRAGIKVYSFEQRKTPGTFARHVEVVWVEDINGDALIAELVHFAQSRSDIENRPVLFLTNDRMTQTIARHVDTVRQYFRLSWADSAVQTASLLDKGNIEARCVEAGLAYPESRRVESVEELEHIDVHLYFPVIFKPMAPLSSFKTFVFDRVEDIGATLAPHASSMPFLAQEFIEGSDEQIFFSALYLDRGRVLAHFEGRKLRSRPMGHTTIAQTHDNPALFAYAKRFFAGLNLSGPVSLEIKRDTLGTMWVIEPTLGRTDFWVGLCVEAGINFPLIEYLHQAGRAIPSRTPLPAIWVNGERDPYVLPRLLRCHPRSLLGGRIRGVYADWRDPLPFLYHLSGVPFRFGQHLLAFISKKLRQLCRPAAERPAVVSLSAGLRVWKDFPRLPTMPAATDPFADLRWFAHLENSTGIAQGDLRLYAITQDKHHFILPMMGSTHSLAGTGVRCVTTLTNFYTPSFDPVTNGNDEFQRRCTERIVAALHGEAPAWDTILFQPLDTETPLYSAIKPALRRAGYLCDDFFCFGNWYLPVEGRDFATYFAGLSSQLRNTVERSRRKLTRNHAGWIDILHLPNENLQKGIDAFETVYRSSWKQAEPYPEFIPGLCRVAAEAGWLRLGVLYADEQPVAAQIWLNTPTKASIYKLAYDERYAKKLSAGSVLTAAMFEHALDIDKVREVDYLIGDDKYKRDWMSHRRERRGVIAFNPRRPRALLAAGRHYLGGFVGRLRK
jgi:D-aspartate ligase